MLAPGQELTPPNAYARLTYNLTLSPTELWVDTHIDLHSGDALEINAVTGTGGCSPNGTKAPPNDTLPLNTALPGALIGKLSEGGTLFFVGSSKQLKIVQLEHLYLRLNPSAPPCTGDILVKVQLLSPPTQATTAKSKLAAAAQTWLSGQFGTGPAKPASTAQGASAASDAPPRSASESAATATVTIRGANVRLDAELCKSINALPRRVNDQFNNLGDMVNFVIVGSQSQVQGAFEAAGWRLADKSVEEAVINVVLVTYQNRDYVQMPMSTLYLFNRAQDFGYEQAEAYSVVASRHHFRLWRAPFMWNGQLVWVGAGTHDIGFEKDQRNGKVTHKIDPNVDGERDHISETLGRAGKIKSLNYHLPPSPIYEARNATGAPYRSDGRLLVILLQ